MNTRILVTGIAVIGLVIGSLAPNAFAAAATPALFVTIVDDNVTAIVGKNFAPNGKAIISITAGPNTGKGTATVRADGRFGAMAFLPATHKGTVKVTATSGTQTASGATTATGTITSASTPSTTLKPATTPAKPATPKPATAVKPATGAQKLGVGGVATPPDAIKATADSKDPLTIKEGGTADKYKVYDGGGHTVGKITIRANYVVVQNFNVRANANLGISIGYGDSPVSHVVVQNNDIKDVKAPGDLNVMEMFGDNITIAYNTAIDAITGDAGKSHTDFVQTWNTHDGWNTTNVIIVGNRATGEPDDAKEQINTHFNQAVIGEGAGASSGGGGTGVSGNWFVSDNYWTADCKFDDIDNVTFTRNTFAGIDKRAVVVSSKSESFKYYSDNKVAGGGRTTKEIGAKVIEGPGPAAPYWVGKGGNFSGNASNTVSP